jgi:hypothetical protein
VHAAAQPPPSAAVPDENLLLNELIREYLHFNGLTSTLSVLLSETGAPAIPLDRPELATLVGVVDDAHSVRLCVARARAAHMGAAPGLRTTMAVRVRLLLCLSIQTCAVVRCCARPLLYELTERSRLRHAPPQPHAPPQQPSPPPPPLSEPASEPASSAPSWD